MERPISVLPWIGAILYRVQLWASFHVVSEHRCIVAVILKLSTSWLVFYLFIGICSYGALIIIEKILRFKFTWRVLCLIPLNVAYMCGFYIKVRLVEASYLWGESQLKRVLDTNVFCQLWLGSDLSGKKKLHKMLSWIVKPSASFLITVFICACTRDVLCAVYLKHG